MIVEVDKTDAWKLLSRPRGENQRPLDHTKIAEYRDKMNTGEWKQPDGSYIELSNGCLTNGQHRLHAFILSELETITFYMQVI